MLICGYVLELHHSLLYHVLDEVLQESLWSKLLWWLVTLVVIYYDLDILSATEVCFPLNKDITYPKLKRHSKVSSVCYTSLWVKICISLCNLTSSLRHIWAHIQNVPYRYLNTCFVATHYICLDTTSIWIWFSPQSNHQGSTPLPVHFGIYQIWI